MHGIRRLIFCALLAAYLTVYAGICALWYRSQETLDTFTVTYFPAYTPDGGTEWSSTLASVDGELAYQFVLRPFGPNDFERYKILSITMAPGPNKDTGFHYRWFVHDKELRLLVRRDTVWQRMGFNWWRSPNLLTTNWSLGVPHWFVLLLLTLPAAAFELRAAVRWRRVRRGLCGNCGYDLRATPERCPECGRGRRDR